MKTLDLAPGTKAWLLALSLAWSCMAPAQQKFATPEKAVEALVQALAVPHPDEARFAQLLGADWRTYIPRGGVQRSDVQAFLQQYRNQHTLEKNAENQALLAVGPEHWTLPIPLVKASSGWHFDLKAAGPEIRARRIGRNELAALQSVLAYHDAQMDYAAVDRNGDGALEYAQRIFSSPGEHDGLYWPHEEGGPVSPLGPRYGEDVGADDWYGYHFRILDAQGPSAPGGAYSYLIGQQMSRGFALIAWPAKYDDTGVMSFMISHDGQVFEKDLGAEGAREAEAMQRFDPDDSWQPVPESTD